MELKDSAKTGPPRGGLREAWGLLRRNPDFARLYSASLISFAGDWFLQVALYGLVLELTGSPFLTSLVLVAHLIPFTLLSPVGGVLADRLDRRKLMIVSDSVRALICLGFLFVNGREDVWLIYVLSAALASLGALFEPAASAAVPNVVDRDDLPAANVLVGSAWGVMLAVGAALGGLVSATLGRDAAFIGDAVSFALSAALLLTIRRRFSEIRERHEHPPIRDAVVETVRYARREPRVLALLAVKGGFGFAGGVISLLPVFAAKVFDAGDAGIGILLGARGLGALVGPFLGRRFIGGDESRLFTAIGIALGTFGVFYLLFPWMPALWIAAMFAVGAHLGGGAQWTLSTYGLQVLVPDRIRGRVFAFDYMLVTASIAISNVVAGSAAGRFDPRIVMTSLAGVALAYALIWRGLAARALARTPAPTEPEARPGVGPAEAPPEEPRADPRPAEARPRAASSPEARRGAARRRPRG
jgi:MFS family permease